MARAKDARKAKERKQKIVLAVAGVLLVGLLAIQGPKFLKLMKGGASTATAATTTSSTTVSATATASTAVHSSVAAGSDKLSSLRVFRASAKDPFVPLVSDAPAAPAPSPAAAAPPVPAAVRARAAKLKPTPASSAPASGPFFGTVDTTTPAKPATAARAGLPTAQIRLNGTTVRVALGQSFPSKKPVFRLAGFQSGGVSIALVEGSLADGASALKLRMGQSLTLVNTSNNVRYAIKLVATKGS